MQAAIQPAVAYNATGVVDHVVIQPQKMPSPGHLELAMRFAGVLQLQHQESVLLTCHIWERIQDKVGAS